MRLKRPAWYMFMKWVEVALSPKLKAELRITFCIHSDSGSCTVDYCTCLLALNASYALVIINDIKGNHNAKYSYEQGLKFSKFEAEQTCYK